MQRLGDWDFLFLNRGCTPCTGDSVNNIVMLCFWPLCSPARDRLHCDRAIVVILTASKGTHTVPCNQSISKFKLDPDCLTFFNLTHPRLSLLIIFSFDCLKRKERTFSLVSNYKFHSRPQLWLLIVLRIKCQAHDQTDQSPGRASPRARMHKLFRILEPNFQVYFAINRPDSLWNLNDHHRRS